MNRVTLRRILLALTLTLSLIVLVWRWFGDGRLRFSRSTATVYRDIRLAEASEVIIPIAPGEFFTQVMGKAGLEAGETIRLIDDVRPVYNLARIQSGLALTLYFRGKWLRNFFYPIDAERYLEVARVGKGNFCGWIRDFPYQVRREMVRLTISGSLYDAAVAADEKAELVERIATMFEYDVDFNRDIRPGDALSVIVEKNIWPGNWRPMAKYWLRNWSAAARRFRSFTSSLPTVPTVFIIPTGDRPGRCSFAPLCRSFASVRATACVFIRFSVSRPGTTALTFGPPSEPRSGRQLPG